MLITCTDESKTNEPKDLESPVISIVYPEDGAIIRESITVKAEANDNDSIMRVAFYVDSALIESIDNYPYELYLPISSYNDGLIHRIHAIAVDASYNYSEPSVVNIIIDSSTCEFVDIPSGNFTYGEGDTIKSIDYDYQMSKYEITAEQYLRFLNAAYNSGAINEAAYGYYPGDDTREAGTFEYIQLQHSSASKEHAEVIFFLGRFELAEPEIFFNHPIADISWYGAKAFCDWYGYDLPNSFEWEKAARGNTGFNYPWGDSISCQNACVPTCNPYGVTYRTAPVGYYNGDNGTLDSPSPYGVYDLSGNVWEWVNSVSPLDPELSEYRGGSYYSSIGSSVGLKNLSSWERKYYEPWRRTARDGSGIGFRCIRILD